MNTRIDASSLPQREEAESGADLMSARVRDVLFDYLDRRAAGESVTEDVLIADHPEIRPELADALKHVRMLSAACEEVAASRDSSIAVRCPNCNASTKVASDSSLVSVTCSACGSAFSLIDDSAEESIRSGAFGPFELIKRLGSGAFGEVYQANDSRLDRTIALKIPRRGQLDAQNSEQFLREARAAAQLQHPNIVSVFEVGRAEDTVYIVSEFIDGTSLAEWLKHEHRVTAREAAALCQKLAAALQHAHAAGVVHRDLKPGNVLIDSAGEPHITDFGLARRETGEVTMTMDGVLIGTPAYMSPEQARGDSHSADARSDVYSLGVILFELLTGELPFRGNVRMVTQQIIGDEAPSPRKLNATVPRDLETITLKCLEKDPLRRYAAARELADDLSRFLRGEPIVARPVSRAERTWRWCRRNPRTAGLSATVAALLLVVAAVTTYSSIQSRAAAREARWQQYLSDMHSAAKAWDEGDVGRVLELLRRNRPAMDEEDLRRFEWYYLWRQCESSLTTATLAHDYVVSALAVTPDGANLVVAVQSPTSGDVINVWDLTRHIKLWSFPGPNLPPAIAISPDSSLLAASNVEFGGPTIWDFATGNQLRKLVGHTGNTRGVVFSPDGLLVATSGDDGTVKLWNPQTGMLDHSFQNERLGLDYASMSVSYAFDFGLAFAPDGQTLAAGSSEGKVMFWDVPTRTLKDTLPAHMGPVNTLGYSRDGRFLATGGADRMVRVWNTADRTLRTAPVAHKDSISGVDISPDATMVASAGSGDGTVRVWDLESGEERHLFKGHSGSVTRVRFAGNNRVISGGADGAVRIWDLTRKYDVNVLKVHKSCSWSIAVGRDGKTIAAGAYLDPTVKIWDLDSGKLLKQHRLATDDRREGIDALAISPDGTWLALGGNLTGHIELWNPTTDETVVLQHLGSEAGGITSLAWSSDGRTLVSGDSVWNDVILWNTISRKERSRLPRHKEWICSVALSPTDNRTLVTRCQDGTLQIWDLTTGKLLKTIDLPAYWFSPLAFSSDGGLLACADVHNVIQIRETTDWQVVQSAVGHTGKVRGLCFSPDGRTLASASSDSTIRLWEVTTGEQRCALSGHRGEVEALTFTPDGQMLVSCSLDGTVRVWRTASDELVRAAEKTDVNRRALATREQLERVPSKKPPFPVTEADWQVVFYQWDSASTGKSWEAVLQSKPICTQRARSINFEWGADSPATSVPPDSFSCVVTGSVELDEGYYRLITLSDDGIRVYLDGQLKIDNWTAHAPTQNAANVEVKAGKHDIRIEFFENTGDATLKFAILPTQNR